MNNDEFEVRLICNEILKKYDSYGYGYDYVYKVSSKLFNNGIRLYMFWDVDDCIGIWEIVDYVLVNFNIINIKDVLSARNHDDKCTDCNDKKADVINFKIKKKCVGTNIFLKRK